MGRRGTVALTKRIVDAARPDHERYHVWDSELSGFGLRIAPTGVKTFIIKYRADGGGRSCRCTGVSANLPAWSEPLRPVSANSPRRSPASFRVSYILGPKHGDRFFHLNQ